MAKEATNPAPGAEYLTVAQAAVHFGLSETTIRDMLKRDQIPGVVRYGVRAVRIPRDAFRRIGEETHRRHMESRAAS